MLEKYTCDMWSTYYKYLVLFRDEKKNTTRIVNAVSIETFFERIQ